MTDPAALAASAHTAERADLAPAHGADVTDPADMAERADVTLADPTLPDMSVVIIAHRRHDHLRRTLAALTDSKVQPREVVVVAMGDPGIAALPEVATPGPGGPAVRVIGLSADPGRLPLARARNAGAAAARARDLVFLDVDCLADPQLLGRYAQALDRLATDPDVTRSDVSRRHVTRPDVTRPVVGAGPVTYLPPDVPGNTTYGSLDWALLRSHRNPHPARPDPPASILERGADLALFWSLSFAISRADYEACGGFDEAYEGYGGEDTDFGRRLGAAGGELWWVGGADAYHQHHPVSRPPVEHLADIVRNAAIFRRRWNEDCMTGWLAQFAERGLVTREPDGFWRLAQPSAGELGRVSHRTRWESRPGPQQPDVVHLIPGPERHGVTRHATSLLAAGGRRPVRLPTGTPAEFMAALAELPDNVGVHLHLSDSLLLDPVGTVSALAERHRVSLTLHDIPTPAEGAERYERRASIYAALARGASLVVVASEHERELLARCLACTTDRSLARTADCSTGRTADCSLDSTTDCSPVSSGDPGHDSGLKSMSKPTSGPVVEVLPLPIEQPCGAARPDAETTLEPVVGVLGYLYPGKGHEEAITAAAAAGLAGVVALGAVSRGHELLAEHLADEAARAGLSWEVTGFLSDADLRERARCVAVPLAYHAHVSASGSIGTWIECGRRPLVADGPWARELAARCPGSLTIARDLGEDVAAAVVDPGSTWLRPGVRVGPDAAQAWQLLVQLLTTVHGAS